MLILQVAGWFIGSCVLMSLIEHQVHRRLMHRANFFSGRTNKFKRVFEAHAIVHHGHYSKIFTDEPVPPGEDKEIRLNVHNALIKGAPIALIMAFVWWPGAIIFLAVACLHHWIWNKVHLEMHKPEQRLFSHWPAYKFLARHHWMHHKHPDKNFNVVFPLFDYIFGTSVRATKEDRIKMQQLGLYDSNHREPAVEAVKEREPAGIK